MKKLYLIRHAKSKKNVTGIRDIDRRLTKRGERQVEYIAKCLKKSGIKVQSCYSSPAKRAYDTAKGIAPKIGIVENDIKIDKSIYNSNILKLLHIVKNISDEMESIAIFGHNPEFLNFVNYLAIKPVKKFPTCAVFGLELKIDSWKNVTQKNNAIVLTIRPGKDV